MMPPANATTPARTTTPNRSSFARTAASPPLRPKTNVPPRLRARMSVGSKPCGTSIGEKHVPTGGRPASPLPRGAARMLRVLVRWVDRSEKSRCAGASGPHTGRSASMTQSTRGSSALAGLDGIMTELEDLYRDVHQHPELSMQEHRTANKAAERLRAAGYDVTSGV